MVIDNVMIENVLHDIRTYYQAIVDSDGNSEMSALTAAGIIAGAEIFAAELIKIEAFPEKTLDETFSTDIQSQTGN